MNLIDTPGFCDSNLSKKDKDHFSMTCADLKDQAVSVVMISCSNLKIDAIIQKSMDLSITMWGEKSINQMIVVVTCQSLNKRTL